VARKPIPDFLEILKVLTDHKVDFIVVGGICAVLHGAPLTTFDLDLVHSRSPDNLDRLISALKELDAHYRGRGDERLTPEVAHLSSPGHQLLMSNLYKARYRASRFPCKKLLYMHEVSDPAKFFCPSPNRSTRCCLLYS